MSTETDTKPQLEWSIDQLRCSAGTDVGLRREENQDSFGIIKREQFHAYLVADGMGGVQGGGVASRLAISSIEESLAKIDEISEHILTKAVTTANAAIHQKGVGDQTLSGMGTTLVGLVFTQTKIFVVNVGDSRAYRFQKLGPKQLSEDHTLVGELIRSGAITKEQAANHPVSHMLTRSLGPVTEVQVDCKELGEMPVDGDVYLLCSDGLYGLVSEREILAVLRESSLDEASQSLIALANDRGGNDNITLILIAFGDHKEGLKAVEEPAPQPTVIEIGPPVEASTVEPSPAMLATADVTPVIESVPTPTEPQPSIEVNPPAENPDSQFEPASPPPQIPEPAPPPKEPPPVVEPASVSDPAVEEQVKSEKSETKEPKPAPVSARRSDGSGTRMILLVAAALLLGLVVGRLFGDMSEGFDDGNIGHTALLAATPAAVPEQLPTPLPLPTVHLDVLTETPVNPEPTVEVGRVDITDETMDTQDRGDTVDIGRLLKTRELFESALSKTEGQLATLDQPITGEIGTTLSVASRRAANLTNRLARIEQEKDAASRKLVQWYTRQKRLETQDPLKLAGEVGATSDDVQKMNVALQKATHEYIRKRDELELYPSNQSLRDEVLKLRDERGKAIRDLQEIVKKQVREVLEETHKKIDELTFEYNSVNWELQSAKQELDVVKARTGGDVAGREQMRQVLTGKREGLKANIAELTLLINSRASAAADKMP